MHPDLTPRGSSCCGTICRVVGGDEGTNHFECSECKKVCDEVKVCHGECMGVEPTWEYCPKCGLKLSHYAMQKLYREMERWYAQRPKT